MTIEIAKTKKSADVAAQLQHVWRTLRDDVDSIKVEDPANPTGNDLSELLNESVRRELSTTASRTLAAIDRDGWETVFGKLSVSEDEKRAAVVDAARSVSVASRPWCRR